MAKRKAMITHSIKLAGFDEPLIEPRLINRALRRAGTVIREEIGEIIASNHHDTGQLEKMENTKQSPVDTKEQSVTVRFINKRMKRDGSPDIRTARANKRVAKGKQYQPTNATVAAILNAMKGFYNKHEEEIQEEAVKGFKEEIAKAPKRR